MQKIGFNRIVNGYWYTDIYFRDLAPHTQTFLTFDILLQCF